MVCKVLKLCDYVDNSLRKGTCVGILKEMENKNGFADVKTGYQNGKQLNVSSISFQSQLQDGGARVFYDCDGNFIITNIPQAIQLGR